MVDQKFIDDYCMRQSIAGDELAFKALYERYGGKVYRPAFRFLKDSVQSEEIVQETFIKLWTGREKLDAECNIWLYLFVIAKRLSINALRQICKSANAIDQLALRAGETHNTTEEQIITHDLEQLTEKILQKLPRQQQLIFRLSREKGLTHRQIADQLQLSPNTVKNHLVEALKNLRYYLKYAGFLWFVLLYF